MIYLDNAATTHKKPPSVIAAVNRALTEVSANPGRGGHSLSLSAAEETLSCRIRLAEMFSSRPENVIFTASCTASINMVLKGLLRPGDHCICSSLEHNAVMRPLYSLSQNGVEYDIARVFPEDFDATRNAFEALIKKNTKLIICTHASNVFGTVLPIKQIGSLCREYGIRFAVDAAQTAGILNISMDEMNIDYLCIAPHKGLYAPMGTGVLIMNSPLPRVLIEGGTGTSSRELMQPRVLPERFESGTVNLPGIMGIASGVDFVTKKTPSVIYTSELKLITALYDRLKALPNVLLYTPRPKPLYYAPVLSFNLSSIPCEDVAQKLNVAGIATRAGLHCAPAAHAAYGTLDIGTVRVSPSVFTSPNHLDRLVFAIKNLKK